MKEEAIVFDNDVDVDPFCDHTCPQVVALAHQLLAESGLAPSLAEVQFDVEHQRAFAIAAFDWVRDEIQYSVEHDWSHPVSWTLNRRRGNCNLKACLLTALFRAAGLEAALCVEWMTTAETFFCVAPSIVSQCKPRSLHFSSAVQIGGHWWQVDATVDPAWAHGMAGVVGDTYQIQFDGRSHAVAKGHVGLEPGAIQRMPSIASFMRKKSRVSPAVRQCFNYSIDYTRRHGHKYHSAQALSQDVEHYILWQHCHVAAEALVGGQQGSSPKCNRSTSPHHHPRRATPMRSHSYNTSNCYQRAIS